MDKEKVSFYNLFDYELTLNRCDRQFAMNLLARRKVEGGKYKELRGEFYEVDPKVTNPGIRPDYEPVFCFEDEQCQELMDCLWRAKFRPTVEVDELVKTKHEAEVEKLKEIADHYRKQFNLLLMKDLEA